MKNLKRNAAWIAFCGSSIAMIIVAVVVSRMMVFSAETIEETSRQRLLALSRAAALLVTAEELNQFMQPEDGRTPEYTELRHKLADFNEISGTEYTYFLRLDEETNKMQFIIDNTLEDAVAIDLPLVPREEAPDIALSGIANTVELGSYSDGWEGYMTAFAPVFYADGSLSNIVAGVDMLDVNIREAQQNMTYLSIVLLFSIVLVLSACFFSLVLYQRKARQALLASEAKSSFLSNTSHEIRTPMHAILGMVDLIMHENISATVLSHVTDIRNACRGLLNVINDILDISKIESSTLEIISSPYHTSTLLSDTISIIKMETEKKKLTFAVDIDPNIPSELIGDELRIKQVLLNLLNNAVKFTHKGQVTLSVRSKVENDDCKLIFSVEDTGIGIKEEDLGKVFMLFQQVDTKKNRNIEGTGLGLTISKQLVEMMGGDIHVESEIGVGSIFTASVEQKVANDEPVAALKNIERNSVLVYENRSAYLDSIIFTLESLDCDYDICTNPSEIQSHLDGKVYNYLFVSHLYIDKIQSIMLQKQPNVSLIVLGGDNNSHDKIPSITMPIHCLQIANILNGEYEYNDYSGDVSFAASITAPEAKVLIVDDNAVNLKVAVGLLRKIFKIQVDTANDGYSAVEMVKEGNDYDLIFMDYMMPEMDGIDTTNIIRNLDKKHQDLPIIALTASATGGVKEMFINEGLNDFLAKPIEMTKLNAILKKWLPQSKQESVESIVATEETYIEIPGLDTQKGVINSGGTLESYNELLTIYVSDCGKRLTDIVEFYQANNTKALTICVHAIKSASANIGANDLSMKAAKLETAGKAEDKGYIDANLQQFLDSLGSLLVDIREYLQNISVEETLQDKPADFDFLKASLVEIEQHLDVLDLDMTESVLKDLCTYQWSNEIFERINDLKKCLDLFDYDGAKTIIAELK